MIVAVNEIAKHPKIISDADEIIYIQDKRKKELKSIVIPASYEPYLHDALKEIEYQMWLKRNKGLLNSKHPEILEDVIDDLGDKI
ncbi:hypothetical protein [Hydrogenimonas thermophila]|uniref:Uncharacterized protein n=1 Tax=Hydrogenimonas thermophila TaxID=223786 RepID=A0A1I5TJN5_9BACT|nr:hypothetical protein [Hydrogenimonas thermophila]WOE71066.1 hypothetical protein RZR91_05700 [Hydrogenimonas thermophila]WOE73584.1 hypothetical protein RZR97_05680 [Hydrogenimonas thermophila]SFP83233.1 hypothetical protein SAMN05216234_1457 [Hydrogenimonas thermophila]